MNRILEFLRAGHSRALLLLALALPLVLPQAAQAVDFKVKGQWQIGFQHSNVRPLYYKGADSFNATQRFRTQIDAVASENLSGTVFFEIGDIEWGNAGNGGGLGADGVIVEVRHAYIDWLIPQTDVKVRMGIQFLQLPGVISKWGFGGVFGHDMAGISVSSPLYKSQDLNVDGTFFWARPYNDNSSSGNNGADWGNGNYLDNLDCFALSIPIRGDRFKINPWGLYAAIGKYSMTGLQVGQEPALVVPRGGLMPVIGGQYYTSGFEQNWVGHLNKAYGDGWWGGLCGSFNITDNLIFAFEGAYGSVDMGEIKHYTGFGGDKTFEVKRAGWYVGARLDYHMDWGTPGILFWYGPGDDDNPYNGSERMPNFNTPWGVTSLGFGGGQYDAFTWKVLGHTPSGMLALVGQIEDISFIEDLKHTLRFGWYKGTNSSEMPRKTGITWYGRADGPHAYLTDKDYAWEINLENEYKIYENFKVGLEAAYVRLDLDEDTWGHDTVKAQIKDNYRVSCLFTYSF